MSENYQVTLFGQPLPIDRPVRKALATPFPGKLTIGEYSRDDQVLKSSWVVSTMTGGLGKHYGEYPQDQDRYDFGTLATLYTRRIMLGARVTQADTLGPADAMIDYSELLYYTVGNVIYRWDTAGNTKHDVGPGMASPATDMAVYFGNLYILNSTDLIQYDGASDTWTTLAGQGGSALVGWDDKLYRLTATGQLYWTITPIDAGSWTAAGSVPLPAGYADQLVVYFDVTGESAIFAITKVGAWVYDADAQVFLRSGLTYPPTRNSGKRACVWRGDLYAPTGQEEYKFNNTTVQVTGPNKDDGLPVNYRGDIAKVVGGHAFRYMFINGPYPDQVFDPSDPITAMFTSSGFDTETFFDPTVLLGLVLVSTGTSWHPLFVDPNIGAGFGAAIVATIEGHHRLFFSSASGLYFVDAPTSLHNPLQNPTSVFNAEGYLDTPWFDAGWSELDKLAVSVEVFARNCTSTETITLWVGWDEDETWLPLGVIKKSGRQELFLNNMRGRLFKSMRLRLALARGSDPSKTPVIDGVIVTFTRQPEKRWSFDLTISIPEEFAGLTATDFNHFLEEITLRQDIGELSYRNALGDIETHYVAVTNARVVEQPGGDHRGLWELTLVEMN